MRVTSKLDWIFEPIERDLCNDAIVSWWEKRRLFYNLFCIAMGIVSLVFYHIFWACSGLLDAADDIIEPMLLPVLVIGAPLCWNLGFVLGPLIQILIPKSRPGIRKRMGPILLKSGIVFSVVVFAMPVVDAGLAFFLRDSIHGHSLSNYR